MPTPPSRLLDIAFALCCILLSPAVHAGNAVNAVNAPVTNDYDETFPSTQREVIAGPPALSQAECEAKPHALWITTQWVEKGVFSDSTKTGQACIRYFPSAHAPRASRPLLFINGDRVEPEGFSDGTYRKQIAFANLIARESGHPTIVIGRPGVYGSTGANHYTDRRTPQEAALIYAAIDTLKERYGWSRLLLSGQSGGGGLVAAMLTMGRNDIDCAAISSGAVAVKQRLIDLRPSNPGRDATGRFTYETYDPIDNVGRIVQNSARRMFIFADRRDKRVSYNSQRMFYLALEQHGVQALFIESLGTGKDYHGLTWPGVRAVGACADGRSDEEIIARNPFRPNEAAQREILRHPPAAAI